MLCPNCKKEIENGAVFCEHCGTRIKKGKKGLWITLSVILMAVIATIVVTTIQEQQAQHQREVERQLQAERKVREEAERKAELIQKGYIDLGLPSGTLWKNANEGGDYTRYTYDEAVSRFGNKLPTKQQLEELKNKCTWTWIGNGYKVTGPNGNSINLPAAGFLDWDGNLRELLRYGAYWSSSPDDSDFAWYLYFNSSKVHLSYAERCCGLSVRLVQ